MASGYFLKNFVLLRKWTPSYASTQDDWSVVTLVVVPNHFRNKILSLAHDNPLSGHLGVTKTYIHILHHFFFFFFG